MFGDHQKVREMFVNNFANSLFPNSVRVKSVRYVLVRIVHEVFAKCSRAVLIFQCTV